jgi:hypothetical protein
MPGFMIFIALGVMLLEKNKILRRTTLVASGALFAFVTAHMLHIVFSIYALITEVH